MSRIVAVAGVLALAGTAHAAIVGVALGSEPRTDPLPLGPYLCKLLPPDPSALYITVSHIPGSPPLTGEVVLDPTPSHLRIGAGWATWSPGYPPRWDQSVYHPAQATSATITLPPRTGAFAFYAEPYLFTAYTFTATADDGTQVEQTAHGLAGAAGFGFYATGESSISSLTVAITGPPPAGFAIGEFYGAQIPESGGAGLLATALLALRRR